MKRLDRHPWLILIALAIAASVALCFCSCSVISYDRAFPTVTWAWTKEAQIQREHNREHKAAILEYQESLTKTNL